MIKYKSDYFRLKCNFTNRFGNKIHFFIKLNFKKTYDGFYNYY